MEISAHWFPHYRDGAPEHPDWARVPLAVALIADPAKGGPHIHGEATHVIAGGLAAQNMALMAQALGLSTTLVTHWIEEKVKVFIECPRAWDLVGVMPFGVAAARPERHHEPLDALVYQDTFGTPWRRGDASEADGDRQPRVAAARRTSSTIDAYPPRSTAASEE